MNHSVVTKTVKTPMQHGVIGEDQAMAKHDALLHVIILSVPYNDFTFKCLRIHTTLILCTANEFQKEN